MLKFEPDASLAFPGHQPFLVVEVAVTQDAEVAKKKHATTSEDLMGRLFL